MWKLAAASLAFLVALYGQTSLPEGPGSDLAYAKCRPCHAMDVVKQSAGISRSMWARVVEEMKDFGMVITASEHAELVEYFATYLGPDPAPPESSGSATRSFDGGQLYDRNCSACHGKDGQGLPGQMPPLAGNDSVVDGQYALAVMIYGLEGPIEVREHRYNTAMPPFGHLSDKDLVAIASYLQTAWGNRDEAVPPTGEMAREIRSKPLAPAATAELRPR